MYFALFMVVILLITGLIWLLDIVALRKNRPVGIAEPWYVEYAKSFFPVILLVFTLRSFLVEPFKILARAYFE
jgi:signal peptidase I